MTDDRTIIQEEGDKLVAAEYVLGVLGAAERRQAQQRLAHDQAFADEVAFWEERLGAFADGVAPVAPPDRTWSRIARKIKARDPSAPSESLWQSLIFWRSFAIGSAALAVASIGALTYGASSSRHTVLLERKRTSSLPAPCPPSSSTATTPSSPSH